MCSFSLTQARNFLLFLPWTHLAWCQVLLQRSLQHVLYWSAPVIGQTRYLGQNLLSWSASVILIRTSHLGQYLYFCKHLLSWSAPVIFLSVCYLGQHLSLVSTCYLSQHLSVVSTCYLSQHRSLVRLIILVRT
jgi:hypothetical protein